MIVVAAVLGIGMIVAGVLAYTGRWREWARRTGYVYCTGFTMLFGGVAFAGGAFLAGVVRQVVPWGTAVDEILPTILAGVFGVAVVSYFWLPPFLLPQWFLEGRDARRRGERDAREARKSARRMRSPSPSSDAGQGIGHEATEKVMATEHLVVRYPGWFSDARGEGDAKADLVLVADVPGRAFVPQMSFGATASSAPVVAAAVDARNDVVQQHPGSRPVSVDAFSPAPDSVSGAPLGRVMMFTCPLGEGHEVLMKVWVIATGRHHLRMTATFLVSDAVVCEAWFDGIASQVRLRADLSSVTEAAVAAEGSVVALDIAGTERAGFPMEDLSVIPTPQARRGRVAAADDARREAGAWGVGRGAPTLLSAVVRRRARQGFYRVHLREEGAVVIRSSGPSAVEMDADRVESYPLDFEGILGDVVAWMGVVPGFRFGDASHITAEEYAGHLDDQDDQDGEDSWTEFRVEFGSDEEAWAMVQVPGEGFFAVTAADARTVTLRVLPSGQLFDLILRRIDGLLH